MICAALRAKRFQGSASATENPPPYLPGIPRARDDSAALIADGREMALCGTAALVPSRTKRFGDPGCSRAAARGVIRWRCICARTSLSMPIGWPGRLQQIVTLRSGRRIAATARARCWFASAGICASGSTSAAPAASDNSALQAVRAPALSLHGPRSNRDAPRRAAGSSTMTNPTVRRAHRECEIRSRTRRRRGSRQTSIHPGGRHANSAIATASAARDALEGSLDHQEVASAFTNRMWLILGLRRASVAHTISKFRPKLSSTRGSDKKPRRIQDAIGTSARGRNAAIGARAGCDITPHGAYSVSHGAGLTTLWDPRFYGLCEFKIQLRCGAVSLRAQSRSPGNHRVADRLMSTSACPYRVM